jgi:hypothetical protein
MKKFFIVLMFLGAAVPAQAAGNCSASASRAWLGGTTIEAFAQGPTCEKAVVTLVIRNMAGNPLFMQAHDTAFLMNFTQAPAANAKALGVTLKDWISGGGFMTSADRLVLDGEFPFTVNEGVGKATLAKYRKEKMPLFCYIQGMESGNCVVLDKDGAVVDLGVQSFPG